VLIAADFFLFSVVGFYVDLMYRGVLPHVVVLTIALCVGLNASLWLIVLSRLSMPFLVCLIVLQFFTTPINTSLANWMMRSFDLKPVSSESGIHFAAPAMMSAIILSYFFSLCISGARAQNRSACATNWSWHTGFKRRWCRRWDCERRALRFTAFRTPVKRWAAIWWMRFAYRAVMLLPMLPTSLDMGSPPGILMGMLKTATRTALLDAEGREPHRTRPVLLDRLNRLLPEVKEPHMYATFTGFRLGADGSVFYALVASPPILQWHASGRTLSHTEEGQFPLGLLPVSSFDGECAT
jgi:Stage II sporulation protein E (SpoIIE)